ncbi:GGDEF domain-containing protein [Actinoplanes sp. TFC3]|uniref:GGDEF domain-containing protein n=1 Tax=Actinoplanes sp. TFC3 TaxID=1710355 RepID=UPI000830761F|nr:GGDEF domain-containing protein [Actinoplanes sp. TFC3]
MAWFLMVMVQPVEPILLGWLLTPAAVLCAVLVCWQAAKARGGRTIAGIFWRRVAVALAVFAISMIARIIDSVEPDLSMTARMSVTSAGLHAAGVALMMWALVLLPAGTHNRVQRAALWLDLGTVTVAAATFLWHFAGTAILAAPGRNPVTVVASIALMIAGLICLLIIAKVALAGTSVLDPYALRMLGAALGVGGLGTALVVVLVPPAYIDPSLLIVPVAVLLIAGAARRDLLSESGTEERATRPRRRFSLLPYTAVAATDTLMLLTMQQDTGDRMLIAVAGVSLTVLVIGRQILTFHQNETLLTRLDEAQQRLQHDATHDALTGLANRSLFEQRLTAAAQHGPSNGGFTVAVIDLDGFKSVNDTQGHAAGDSLLRYVADTLRCGVRSQDTVARLGGDEFVILFHDLTGEAVDDIIVRLHATLAQPADLDGHHRVVRASFGAAGGVPGVDPAAVLRDADLAMYRAKSRGGGFERHREREADSETTRIPGTPQPTSTSG